MTQRTVTALCRSFDNRAVDCAHCLEDSLATGTKRLCSVLLRTHSRNVITMNETVHSGLKYDPYHKSYFSYVYLGVCMNRGTTYRNQAFPSTMWVSPGQSLYQRSSKQVPPSTEPPCQHRPDHFHVCTSGF